MAAETLHRFHQPNWTNSAVGGLGVRPLAARANGLSAHRRPSARAVLVLTTRRATTASYSRSMTALCAVDRAAARLARPQAVPQVLRRRDDQRRLPVLMKRTPPHQVRPMPPQFDPRRRHQPFERNFPLQPLDLTFRNARYGNRPPSKICQSTFVYLRILTVVYLQGQTVMKRT